MAEEIARAFHEAYERLAPDHSYKTREASAVPWDQVPENNRNLMTAVVQELLDQDFIVPGTKLTVKAGAPSYAQPETMQPRIGEVSQQMEDAAAERSGQATTTEDN